MSPKFGQDAAGKTLMDRRAEQWPEQALGETASGWLRRTGGYGWRKTVPSIHSSSVSGTSGYAPTASSYLAADNDAESEFEPC